MLSYLKIHGTPFDVGAALGRFGARAMQEYAQHSSSWASVMQWRGHARVRAMADRVQQLHPGYWQELQGLAHGLELPAEDVFLWNCRGDLWAMAPDGCTTVQLPGSRPVMAHNEDGDPAFAGHCAVAQIDVDGGGRFASFVYPGSLPGHTFAVNAAGLAMTVNNLRTLEATAGLPRMVATRAILDISSVAEAIEFLRGVPRAGGFHLTLAQAGHADLTSVEFSDARVSVCGLDRPAVHANHMVHAEMTHHPQVITGSSGHRQIRGQELLDRLSHDSASVDPLTILFDQDDARFPIYRDSRQDSDNENTMATATFEVLADHVAWTVHAKRSRQGLFRMRNEASHS